MVLPMKGRWAVARKKRSAVASASQPGPLPSAKRSIQPRSQPCARSRAALVPSAAMSSSQLKLCSAFVTAGAGRSQLPTA